MLEFQVHEESIELASRADDALAAANQSGNYDDFNRARFGFETALEQWPENARAVDGLSETRRDYSQLAFGRGDFELALSLLDAADPDQARLVAPIQAADEERSSREVRVRRLRRFGIAATLTIAMLASVAAVWINAERTIALNAQQEEATQRGIAEKNEKDAKEQRRMAQSALGEARLAESKARLAEADARREADIARRNLKLAERNAYSSDMLLSYRDWDDRALIQLGERLDRYRDRDELQGFEWHYLYRNAHRDVLTIGTQEVDLMRIGYYEDASFSPDGALIATCGTDRVVTLWNAEDGSVVAVLRGHEGRVTSVAFSADGSMIASASEDETIKLWDVASLMETETIHGHKGAVFCVCFNADGTQLASAGLDTTVKLWSTAGELVSTLNGHQGMVFSVDFSHDGQSIASAGADAVVRLWNSSTGQETAMLRGHTGPVQCVKFSTDGKRLVSASSDRTLKLWDVKSARELHTFEGHSDAVRSVAFAPDELRIVSGSDDHTARIWNTATGRERATLEGHAGSVDAVSVSPDGLRIVSASGDRTIKLWSIGTGSSVATFNGHKAAVLSVAFSPAGNEIASGGFDGTIRLWHLPLNQEIAVLKGHINRVRSVVFNRDGSRIVSGSEDRTVRIWDIPNGGDSIDFLGHTDWILQVAISPDGSRIGSASMDGTARVWNSQNQKELFAFDGSPTRQGKLQPVNAIVFSPDGRTVAFGSGRAVVLRDAITGLKIGDLTGHTNTVVSLAFSADGTILASGSMDTTVRLWELATGKEVARLAGYSRSVAISPDSSRLITSNAGEVRMWDMETNREVATFTGHRLNVASVAFSPGGLRIASASMDGTVKVWDARPWTPELRAESQAQGYLAVHSEHVESFEELQAVIRADETITESVRKRALDWAELFWKNREPDRN